MTRIALDLRMYRHSGIGRYLRNLIPLLLPLLRVDAVRVLGSDGLFAEARWLGDPRVELFHTDAPIYSIAEQLLPLRGAFRDTTLVWVPHFNAPLLYRGRLALTVHDIAPLALPEILGSPLKRAYARLLIESATSHASAILCPSAFTASELQRHLGTPPRKITVAPLALDDSWPATARPHREPGNTPYFLYVGNIKPNKNLTLLLTAFARVGGHLPHRLLLAGRIRGFGTDDDAVLRQAERLGDRVRFTGEIDDAQLIALYAGASALVLPSLYEGFGLPVLEAMHFNCPVFAASATSLPEVAGNAALFFDPRSPESLTDCLLSVTDQTQMGALRLAGIERVAHFSYARCATQTAAILNPLLQGPR